MTTTVRLLLCGLLLLSLLVPAVFAVVLLQWSIEQSASASDQNEVADSRHSSSVFEKNYELIHCNEEKGKVTKLLLAGQLSLVQAIEEFRRLNDELEFFRPASMAVPIPHSDEALAKSVLSWTWAQALGRPDRTSTLHRLEEEREHLFPHRSPRHTALH